MDANFTCMFYHTFCYVCCSISWKHKIHDRRWSEHKKKNHIYVRQQTRWMKTHRKNKVGTEQHTYIEHSMIVELNENKKVNQRLFVYWLRKQLCNTQTHNTDNNSRTLCNNDYAISNWSHYIVDSKNSLFSAHQWFTVRNNSHRHFFNLI